MKLNRHDAQVEMEMNMTPMIDVTFLLIIFFMLITDLSQQDLEFLELPVAYQAAPDKPDPMEVRPVVNVLADGQVIVKREALYDPAVGDMTRLERYLADQANLMLQKGDWKWMNPETQSGPKLPANPLLIRSDENTPFNMIQRIMQLCGKEGIRIWKLELAAAEDPAKAEERRRAALEATQRGG